MATEIDSIPFLIPGGAGGGWDGTARGTGEALTKAGTIGDYAAMVVHTDSSLGSMADLMTAYKAEFVNWRGFFGLPGLSADRQAAYVAALEKMYATDEWETVRARNGWVKIFNPGDQFVTFLEQQEAEISSLMKELGFL
jgi:putative tricarboxylic transport membrane protein